MTKPYRLDRSAQATRDLRVVLRFLIKSHMQFGEPFAVAKQRATERVIKIEDEMEALAMAPHQGTLSNKLIPNLRHVTKDRAIIYFTVDDEARVVRVLAVFFGGQDHQRAMLRRLLRS